MQGFYDDLCCSFGPVDEFVGARLFHGLTEIFRRHENFCVALYRAR